MRWLTRFRRREAEVEVQIKSRVMMASRVMPLKARCAGPFELTIAEVETAAAERKHAGTRQQNDPSRSATPSQVSALTLMATGLGRPEICHTCYATAVAVWSLCGMNRPSRMFSMGRARSTWRSPGRLGDRRNGEE